MRPVTVKEILNCRERLGITESVEPSGGRGSVRHLLRDAGGASGRGMTPLPQSLLILPPVTREGAARYGWNGSLLPPRHRNITCLALPAQEMAPFHRLWSEQTKTPMFSSIYDDSLLYSRLLGLLRERGERLMMVHGVLVRIGGFGVLLLGESGIGKTRCGLLLVGEGHRWVADDAVVLEGRGGAVYGRGHRRTAGRIALRGLGILRATDLLGTGNRLHETRLHLLVRFVRRSEGDPLPEGGPFREILGVPIPCRDLVADDDPRRMAERVTGCLYALLERSSAQRTGTEERSGATGARRIGCDDPRGGESLPVRGESG